MRFCSITAGIFLTALCTFVANSAPLPDENKKSNSGLVSEYKSKEPEKKSTNDIFQFDNPSHQEVLNKPTLPVKKLPDSDIDELIETMLVKMRGHGSGVGISANQVGHSLQISIVTNPFDLENPGNYKVYINPVITSASEKVYCFWHGCLSALDRDYGKVATWQEITVTALNQKGESFTDNLKGTDAVIFQHEFRHLLGGGYMDHASTFRTEAEMKQAMVKELMEKKFSYLEHCKDGEKPLLDDYKVGETIAEYSKRVLSGQGHKTGNKKKESAVNKTPEKQDKKKE